MLTCIQHHCQWLRLFIVAPLPLAHYCATSFAFVFEANHLARSSVSCCYHEQHSCIFGASFRDAPYILLQSDFIALTVVCDILNASFHCDILSALLRTCCCSSIIVALHRTMGSLPLHYWHHLPWCFLDELVCCGQLRLVNSGTMEWSHLQTL